MTFLKRTWVLLVVVVAVVLGGVAVTRLRGVFGSDAIFTATGSSAEPLQPSHHQAGHLRGLRARVDTTGSVSYLDKDARPEQAELHRPAVDLHDHDDGACGHGQCGGTEHRR